MSKVVTFFSLLFLATLMLAAIVRVEEHKKTPVAQGALEGVAFREARASDGVRISIKVHREAGGEFSATAMGFDQVRVAYDAKRYWFWVRSYDPLRYYFSDLSELSKTEVAPAMRPLFMRCTSGAEFFWRSHPSDGTLAFDDGEYIVEVSFSGGRPTRQTYSIDGRPVLVVSFVEYQEASGFCLPRRLRVAMEGLDAIEVDLGKAEVNPDVKPKTEPPRWMEGFRIQP